MVAWPAHLLTYRVGGLISGRSVNEDRPDDARTVFFLRAPESWEDQEVAGILSVREVAYRRTLKEGSNGTGLS